MCTLEIVFVWCTHFIVPPHIFNRLCICIPAPAPFKQFFTVVLQLRFITAFPLSIKPECVSPPVAIFTLKFHGNRMRDPAAISCFLYYKLYHILHQYQYRNVKICHTLHCAHCHTLITVRILYIIRTPICWFCVKICYNTICSTANRNVYAKTKVANKYMERQERLTIWLIMRQYRLPGSSMKTS